MGEGSKSLNSESFAERMARSRLERGQVKHKDPLEKAKEQPTSLRRAITAKCYDCIGRNADPDWRGSIRNCLCTDCPLYVVRPFKVKE